MNAILAFIKQPVPKAGHDMPSYYKNAILSADWLLLVYFPLSFMLMGLTCHRWEWMPLLMLMLTALGMNAMGHINARLVPAILTGILGVWICWYVHIYGWDCGVQHFLKPLMVLLFFNIYEPPVLKIVYFVLFIAFRLILFQYAHVHTSVYTLPGDLNAAFQVVNSISISLMLALNCILLSSSIQDTERQLRLDNQALHREAGTDPLTQLPNRRAMLDFIEAFLKSEPEEPYCVAIADIDLFKGVNDTYGHQCGDYTLKTLADLFRQSSNDAYTVCRWGGEEFCFFLPRQNLDQGGAVMLHLCDAVARMPLSFEGHDFTITVTIGVEETDFTSPLDHIIEEADRKLYIGKNSGRNQVVI